MEKFAFEILEKDEERGVSIFDIKVIEADSFGEAQRIFEKKYECRMELAHIYH
jgi:hypothetical protein